MSGPAAPFASAGDGQERQQPRGYRALKDSEFREAPKPGSVPGRDPPRHAPRKSGSQWPISLDLTGSLSIALTDSSALEQPRGRSNEREGFAGWWRGAVTVPAAGEKSYWARAQSHRSPLQIGTVTPSVEAQRAGAQRAVATLSAAGAFGSGMRFRACSPSEQGHAHFEVSVGGITSRTPVGNVPTSSKHHILYGRTWACQSLPRSIERRTPAQSGRHVRGTPLLHR
jgi:hypothetical protein